MRRLVKVMSDGSADVAGQAVIRCLWYSEVVAVPPYRPRSFFFKGSSAAPEGAWQWALLPLILSIAGREAGPWSGVCESVCACVRVCVRVCACMCVCV
jgi:hypothetical protein